MSVSELYPGLDYELEAAYKRNIGAPADEESISVTGLEAVVKESGEPSLEVKEWAYPQLEQALGAWQIYEDQLVPPRSTEQLKEEHPKFKETLDRLHSAKKALNLYEEPTPENLNLGDTMNLVLVPWAAIERNLGSFESFDEELRLAQGEVKNDWIDPNFLEAIKNDAPMYISTELSSGNLIRPREYLQQKIAFDGPWGIILAQTSNKPGLAGLNRESPDQMTANGITQLSIDVGKGLSVGAMGIFEYLALTLQQNPRSLSRVTGNQGNKQGDRSWLPANRFYLGNRPHVPYVYSDPHVHWKIAPSTTVKANRYPRLAVT